MWRSWCFAANSSVTKEALFGNVWSNVLTVPLDLRMAVSQSSFILAFMIPRGWILDQSSWSSDVSLSNIVKVKFVFFACVKSLNIYWMEDIFWSQGSRNLSKIYIYSFLIDLENALLIWQTSYVWFMVQFKFNSKMCLSPFTTIKSFFWNKVPC